MLSKYIQAPYIDTCLGLATPALIISVVYLLVLSVFLKSAEKKGSLKIEIEKLCDFMPGEKNKITISIIGYVVSFVLVSIYLSFWVRTTYCWALVKTI